MTYSHRSRRTTPTGPLSVQIHAPLRSGLASPGAEMGEHGFHRHGALSRVRLPLCRASDDQSLESRALVEFPNILDVRTCPAQWCALGTLWGSKSGLRHRRWIKGFALAGPGRSKIRFRMGLQASLTWTSVLAPKNRVLECNSQVKHMPEPWAGHGGRGSPRSGLAKGLLGLGGAGSCLRARIRCRPGAPAHASAAMLLYSFLVARRVPVWTGRGRGRGQN